MSTIRSSSSAQADPELEAPRSSETGISDLEWFTSNFERLRAAYPNEWIAVSHQEIVAHARSAGELRRKVDEARISSPFIGRLCDDAWARIE